MMEYSYTLTSFDLIIVNRYTTIFIVLESRWNLDTILRNDLIS